MDLPICAKDGLPMWTSKVPHAFPLELTLGEQANRDSAAPARAVCASVNVVIAGPHEFRSTNRLFYDDTEVPTNRIYSRICASDHSIASGHVALSDAGTHASNTAWDPRSSTRATTPREDATRSERRAVHGNTQLAAARPLRPRFRGLHSRCGGQRQAGGCRL